jgi:hypothetical protein
MRAHCCAEFLSAKSEAAMKPKRYLCLFVLLAFASPARAESDGREFVPEVDAFVKTTDRIRLFLRGSLTRETTKDTTDGEIGAHMDFTLKPILRSRLREEDWERERYLWMRVGYAVMGDLDNRDDGFTERRGVLEVTARAPLPHEAWLVNRIKMDLRDVDGETSRRYRYRLGIEHEFTAGSTVWVPYAEVEAFYDTRYDAWNRRLYQAGLEIALTKTWRVEPYIAHQTDQRSAAGNLNQFGFVLKYYR